MKTVVHFRSYLAHFFLEWKIFKTKVVKKLETHILCPRTFFSRKSCRLWDKLNKMTIWPMSTACRIPKTTNTHIVCVIVIYFHCNSGCTNAPQCYVMSNLPVLFYLGTAGTYNHVTDPCGNQDVRVAFSSLSVGYTLLHLNYYLQIVSRNL